MSLTSFGNLLCSVERRQLVPTARQGGRGRGTGRTAALQGRKSPRNCLAAQDRGPISLKAEPEATQRSAIPTTGLPYGKGGHNRFTLMSNQRTEASAFATFQSPQPLHKALHSSPTTR